MIGPATHRFWIGFLKRWPDNLVVLDRAAALHGCESNQLSPLQKIDYTYRVLTILDDKAQSLMQFNAFVIALVALFWPSVTDKTGIVLWSAFLTVGTSMLSILFCLFVVGVFWGFLGIAVPRTRPVPTSPTPSEVPDLFSTEVETLCKVVGMRESAYQLAWTFSLVSLIALVPIFYRALMQ